MNAESIIRQLLLDITDARSPLVNGNHGSGGGTGPSMSSEWHHGSFQPLEDALKEMKSLGKQQAVSGVPLSTLWWHLAQRYLMSERKAIWKVGSRTVDSMVRQRRCICEFKFYNPEQARHHIELVHKPKPELTVVYPTGYKMLLRDQPGRCEICERLAVQWIVEWFKKNGITPRLPKEKT